MIETDQILRFWIFLSLHVFFRCIKPLRSAVCRKDKFFRCDPKPLMQ